MHFKIYTLFQNFIMQITLKYITPIIRHLLGIKVFHNHMLFTAYFDKRNKSLKHYAARNIFNIDFLKLNRSPPSLSQILHWCRWLLFTSIKIFWSNKWLKSDVSFFFIEILSVYNMQCLYGKADSDVTFRNIACLINKKIDIIHVD